MLSKSRRKWFCGGFWGPSLETGTVFDAVLSVNYCANRDWVSVRAVREKCDEKGRGQSSDFVAAGVVIR